MTGICKICSNVITTNELKCDGICENHFHSTCLKRGYKTCNDCLEIKPCHVLRLMRDITNSLSSDQSFILNKVNHISSNWGSIEVLSDDINSLNDKINGILERTKDLQSTSDVLLGKANDIMIKLSVLSNSIDDVQSAMASNCSDIMSNKSPGNGINDSVLPAIIDIRRSVGQLKGEIGTCSAAINKNHENVNSLVSEVMNLTQQTQPPKTAAKKKFKKLSKTRRRHTTLNTSSNKQDVSDKGVPANLSIAPDSSDRNADSNKPINNLASDVHSGFENNYDNEQMNNLITIDASSDTDKPPVASLPIPTDPLNVTSGPTLKAAIRYKCVFLSGIEADTSGDVVIKYIKEVMKYDKHFRVERINSKHGQCYSSFKIYIPQGDMAWFLDNNNWTIKGLILKEFVSLNKKTRNFHKLRTTSVECRS